MGACLGPTTKLLSKEGEQTELSKPEYVLVTWVAITGEVNMAVRRDELEAVMAGPDRNVERMLVTLTYLTKPQESLLQP